MANWYRELRNLMEGAHPNPKVLELVNKLFESKKTLLEIQIPAGAGVITALSQEAKARGFEFHIIYVDKLTPDASLPSVNSKTIIVLQDVEKASPDALQMCYKLASGDCKVIKVTYH